MIHKECVYWTKLPIYILFETNSLHLIHSLKIVSTHRRKWPQNTRRRKLMYLFSATRRVATVAKHAFQLPWTPNPFHLLSFSLLKRLINVVFPFFLLLFHFPCSIHPKPATRAPRRSIQRRVASNRPRPAPPFRWVDTTPSSGGRRSSWRREIKDSLCDREERRGRESVQIWNLGTGLRSAEADRKVQVRHFDYWLKKHPNSKCVTFDFE